MGSVKVGIDLKQINKDLEHMKKAPKKVVERTLNDFRKRAPGWVADDVRKVYNIKKSEITIAKKGKAAGSIKAVGETIGSVGIVYKGRLLTPVHFSMSPAAPKQTYTLKAQFMKGQKKTLGKVKKLTKKQRANVARNLNKQGTQSSKKSPIMLMHTGNTKVDGVNYIPFQRVSKNRKDVKVIKTLSVPQMVTNPRVETAIYYDINEKLGKRFDHYVDMYVGK